MAESDVGRAYCLCDNFNELLEKWRFLMRTQEVFLVASNFALNDFVKKALNSTEFVFSHE